METKARLVNFEPDLIMEKQRNRTIALSIHEILNKQRKTKKRIDPHIEKLLKMIDSGVLDEGYRNKNNIIRLGMIPDENVDVGAYPTTGDVKKGFKFPVYVVNMFTYDFKNNKIFGNRTDYGLLSDSMIGPDGYYYFTDNIYFFNMQGEAIKQTGISRGKKLDEESTSPRINFIPKEYSRYEKLDEKDYAKVSAGLRLIKNNTFRS